MTSANSFCNWGLTRNLIARLWPAALLYGLAWMVVLVLPLTTAAIMTSSGISEAADLLYQFASCLGAPSAAFLFAFVLAIRAFGWQLNKPGAEFFGALPCKRNALYASGFLAMLLPLLAVNVLVGLFACGAAAIVGMGVETVLTWFAYSCLCDFIFCALAVFCLQLTGTKLFFGLMYLLVNLGFAALGSGAGTVMSTLIYGMVTSNSNVLVWLSPLSALFENLGNGTAADLLVLGAYSLVGIGALFAGAALLRHRPLECAGDGLAFPRIRPVLTILLALVVGLQVADMFYVFTSLFTYVLGSSSTTLLMTLQMAFYAVVGSLLVYCAAEAVLARSLRILAQRWKGMLVVAGVTLAFVLGCGFDVLNMADSTPDPSQVEGATISAVSNATFTSEEGIQQVEDIQHAIVAGYKAGEWNNDGDSLIYDDDIYATSEANTYACTLTITYMMKDGSIDYRRYNVYLNEADTEDTGTLTGKLWAIDSCDEACESRIAALQAIADTAGMTCMLNYRTREVSYTDTSDYEDVYMESSFNSYDVGQLIEQGLGQDIRENHALSTLQWYVQDSMVDDGQVDASFSLSCDYAEEGVTSLSTMAQQLYLSQSNYINITLSTTTTPNTLNYLEHHYGMTFYSVYEETYDEDYDDADSSAGYADATETYVVTVEEA